MMKHAPLIGIVGGYGPATSARFCDRLVRYAQSIRQDVAPSFILDSVPISMGLAIRCVAGDPTATRALVDAANGAILRLAMTGVRTVAIPCNSLHALFDEFVRPPSVTLLHIADPVVHRVRSQGRRRIGLLASSTTVMHGMYQRRLAAANVAFALPRPEDQTDLNACIGEFVGTGTLDRRARVLFRNLALRLEADSPDGIVLGCTDIDGMLDVSGARLNVALIDSMDTFAETCARFSIAMPAHGFHQ